MKRYLCKATAVIVPMTVAAVAAAAASRSEFAAAFHSPVFSAIF